MIAATRFLTTLLALFLSLAAVRGVCAAQAFIIVDSKTGFILQER